MRRIGRRSLIRWTAIISIATSTVVVMAIAASSAKSMQQIYVDFGVAVPTLTRFAYSCYPYTSLSFVLIYLILRVTGASIIGSRENLKFVVILAIGVIAYIAWLVAIGVGLYIPHHVLGQLG
jgi:hypothetical protein